MNFVTAQPDSLAVAAGRLHEIGSALTAQSSATAAPMTGVVPAAADVVSMLTAARFAGHGQLFQALSAQAAALHENFAITLQASAGSYAATEAINAASAR
ncbi:PE family protein [Mycobacterium colombiense]|uniref:PE family protein n=1 Tax=Mycobacterium colombiense TaxID=339268 RepID=A0A329KUZ5_9MYCO|nr:PE family protein [Mycobacterium colombiense]RAU95786.1 PE family protein [Mycobacterium colombiense]